MSKPPPFRQLSDELAIVLTPLAIFFGTGITWLTYAQANRGREALLILCLTGILLLAVLLGVGFQYYRTHPFVGLLTALTLFSLLPASQAANGNDAWQFVSGMATGLGGGALTITFLVLSLIAMKRADESAAPTELSHGPDTPHTRWLHNSGGSGVSHQVEGADGEEAAWRIFSREHDDGSG